MAKDGITQKVYIKGTGTPVHTWIAGETKHTVDYKANTLDVSTKDSAWDEFQAGSRSWSGSASFLLDNTASQPQKTLLDSFIAGEEVDIFMGTLSTDAETEGMYGTAIITAITETKERGSVMSRDISFQGTGAPTMVYPA